MENNQHPFFNQLKKTDPDRAFLLFFAPKAYQTAFAVIDLWNAELMDQLCMITEPHMALIRLQWWKDQLAQAVQPTQSPQSLEAAMPQQLKGLMMSFPLTAQDFIAVLDALGDGLSVDEGTDAHTFAQYLLGHQGGLLRLKAQLLGVEHHYMKLIESLGSVYGLMRGVYSLSAPQSQINVRSMFRDYFLTGSKAELGKTIKGKMAGILNHISHHDQLSFGEARYFRALQALINLYHQEIVRADFMPQNFKPLRFKEFKIWWKS